MSKPRIITRTVLLVSLVSLFTDVASEMLYPVMPVYLDHIGFSVVLIGVLEGMAEAMAGLSKGYFGKLSDRVGKRVPFVRLGYGLSAISKPMMALWIWPIWIFFARLTDRLGKGVRTGARDALLSAETTREHKARVFGFHRSLDTLGAAIGPFVALIYLYYHPGDYRTMFFLAFIPALLGVGLTFLLKDRRTEKQEDSNGKGFLSYLKYWNVANASYRKLVVFLLIFTLLNSSDAFLLLLMKERGIADTSLILIYIFYNIIYALASYPVGILADRIGMKTAIISGLTIFGLVYLLFPQAGLSIPFYLALFFGYGLYAAATEGVAKAWITNLCKKEDTATAIGFYTSLGSVATMVASGMAGVMWQWGSVSLPFIVSGAGAVLLAVLLLIIPLREHQHEEYA